MLGDMDFDLSYTNAFTSVVSWDMLHNSIQKKILKLCKVSYPELCMIAPIDIEINSHVINTLVKVPDNESDQLELLRVFQLILEKNLSGEELTFIPIRLDRLQINYH